MKLLHLVLEVLHIPHFLAIHPSNHIPRLDARVVSRAVCHCLRHIHTLRHAALFHGLAHILPLDSKIGRGNPVAQKLQDSLIIRYGHHSGHAAAFLCVFIRGPADQLSGSIDQKGARSCVKRRICIKDARCPVYGLHIAYHIGDKPIITGVGNAGRRSHSHHHIPLLYSVRVPQDNGLHVLKHLTVHLGAVHAHHGHTHDRVSLFHSSLHHRTVGEHNLDRIRGLYCCFRRENQYLAPGLRNHCAGKLARSLDGIVKPVPFPLDGMHHHHTGVRLGSQRPQMAVQFIQILHRIRIFIEFRTNHLLQGFCL